MDSLEVCKDAKQLSMNLIPLLPSLAGVEMHSGIPSFPKSTHLLIKRADQVHIQAFRACLAGLELEQHLVPDR